MNGQLLIDAVVQQVTVLIAQLATSGGLRAPVAQIANQVFVQLARELEGQGVSRKVSADMFGMALRAYQRKLRRLTEGVTDPGSTLWRTALEFIRSVPLVTRLQLTERFARDEERQLSSVLHDLVESGLVFRSGSGAQAAYRAASEAELGELSRLSSEQGLEEWLWVLVYRDGPFSESELAERVASPPATFAAALARLEAEGRVQRLMDGRLGARDFVVPLGSARGWEAAVFDHLKAVVQTVCQRLQLAESGNADAGTVGGSTYGFDIWPGHPHEQEVLALLRAFRERSGELRARVEAHNRQAGLPAEFLEVVSYVGQCVFERERDTSKDANGNE
jgi:DNA-binding MarR family transcriptional regulator